MLQCSFCTVKDFSCLSLGTMNVCKLPSLIDFFRLWKNNRCFLLCTSLSYGLLFLSTNIMCALVPSPAESVSSLLEYWTFLSTPTILELFPLYENIAYYLMSLCFVMLSFSIRIVVDFFVFFYNICMQVLLMIWECKLSKYSIPIVSNFCCSIFLGCTIVRDTIVQSDLLSHLWCTLLPMYWRCSIRYACTRVSHVTQVRSLFLPFWFQPTRVQACSSLSSIDCSKSLKFCWHDADYWFATIIG